MTETERRRFQVREGATWQEVKGQRGGDKCLTVGPLDWGGTESRISGVACGGTMIWFFFSFLFFFYGGWVLFFFLFFIRVVLYKVC